MDKKKEDKKISNPFLPEVKNWHYPVDDKTLDALTREAIEEDQHKRKEKK